MNDVVDVVVWFDVASFAVVSFAVVSFAVVASHTFLADVQLPGQNVSRQHAELFNDGLGRLTIRDLDSRNGTYVNGQRVEESDVVLWYSTALRPKVKGRQIGSGWGVYKPDATIQADIEALIEVNGCASEPLALIERYFHE